MIEFTSFDPAIHDYTSGNGVGLGGCSGEIGECAEPLPAGATVVRGPVRMEFPVQFSVFAGCYNLWGRNEYWIYKPFKIDIESVASASTCGSPIFSSGSWWVGLLCDAPGSVESDGNRVIVSIPQGQALLVFDPLPADESPWQWYLRLAARRLVEGAALNRPAAHAYDWEYCTWVEQKRLVSPGQHPRTVLDDGLVRSLAERVLKLGIEPGKFTIDDGWQELPAPPIWTDGYWRPNRVAFPDLAKTCAWLRARGFVPGLWFGMGWYPKAANLRTERPSLFGQWEVPEGMESPGDDAPWSLAAGDETEAYLRETLRPYAQMGFRKFKFDFFYGQRRQANAVMRTLWRAVRSLDPTIEIESHHPDFFFSRWCDTVRLNDVLVQPGRDWESLTLSHMRVTRLCAPDRIMNLDHLGGNDPRVGEADYLRHLEILDISAAHPDRYAVLSLLPDHYSPSTVKRVVEFVSRHRRPPC